MGGHLTVADGGIDLLCHKRKEKDMSLSVMIHFFACIQFAHDIVYQLFLLFL